MSTGTDYNYDEQVHISKGQFLAFLANTMQGQFFPYFILTIAAIITVPTTYSWLKPNKGQSGMKRGFLNQR